MTEDPLTHYIEAAERMRLRADAAEARLGAVLALCDEGDPEMTFPEWQNKVRAAARGEGARG